MHGSSSNCNRRRSPQTSVCLGRGNKNKRCFSKSSSSGKTKLLRSSCAELSSCWNILVIRSPFFIFCSKWPLYPPSREMSQAAHTRLPRGAPTKGGNTPLSEEKHTDRNFSNGEQHWRDLQDTNLHKVTLVLERQPVGFTTKTNANSNKRLPRCTCWVFNSRWYRQLASDSAIHLLLDALR